MASSGRAGNRVKNNRASNNNLHSCNLKIDRQIVLLRMKHYYYNINVKNYGYNIDNLHCK